MTEISDEFKVIIVDAIRSLCLKFPAKHASMLTFLSSVLRDEGGYEFKRAVVEAMFDMIKFIPESKEQALSHLCEFIEDCEFTKLSVRILHLLGVEGTQSPQPAKYIRFIYNRVVLENATVRAAAVTSLAKFGVNSAEPTLKKSITVLLNRSALSFSFSIRYSISPPIGALMMWMMRFATAQRYTSKSSERSHWQIHMSKKVKSSYPSVLK